MINELRKYKKFVLEYSKMDKLNYRFRKPNNLDSKKKHPILIYLHGAGGRGDNNKDQLLDAGGINAFVNQKIFSKYNSYFLAAQVPKESKWVDVDWDTLDHKMPIISKTMKMLFHLIDTMIKNENNKIDTKRIYILGVSMGGYGVWDALLRRPNFFAAGVPICGGGDTSKSKLISHIPIWSWHGDQDSVISVERSRDMYTAIKKTGGVSKYSEIKNRGHDVWLDVWNSKKLWEWLYSKSL